MNMRPLGPEPKAAPLAVAQYRGCAYFSLNSGPLRDVAGWLDGDAAGLMSSRMTRRRRGSVPTPQPQTHPAHASWIGSLVIGNSFHSLIFAGPLHGFDFRSARRINRHFRQKTPGTFSPGGSTHTWPSSYTINVMPCDSAFAFHSSSVITQPFGLSPSPAPTIHPHKSWSCVCRHAPTYPAPPPTLHPLSPPIQTRAALR